MQLEPGDYDVAVYRFDTPHRNGRMSNTKLLRFLPLESIATTFLVRDGQPARRLRS